MQVKWFIKSWDYSTYDKYLEILNSICWKENSEASSVVLFKEGPAEGANGFAIKSHINP